MTDKVKRFIDNKIQNSVDEWHDTFLTIVEEMHVQMLPTDYIKYVRQQVMLKMIELAEDLTDEFDEEVDD